MLETFRCPRCGTAMVSARSRTALMFGCTTCGGIWLDNADSRRVVSAICDDTLHKADVLARFAKKDADRAAPISCPECSAPLARWTVEHAEIAVDQCPKHGAWFDRDELTTIARTIAARQAYVTGSATQEQAKAVAPVADDDADMFSGVGEILSQVE